MTDKTEAQIASHAEFETWLDKDWPLWRNDTASSTIQRLRRAWDAARADPFGGREIEAHLVLDPYDTGENTVPLVAGVMVSDPSKVRMYFHREETEKPAVEGSDQEADQHYLAVAQAFLSKMRTCGPITEPEDIALQAVFARFARYSDRIGNAIEYVGPWCDLGTWEAPTWAIQLASILTGGDGCGKWVGPGDAGPTEELTVTYGDLPPSVAPLPSQNEIDAVLWRKYRHLFVYFDRVMSAMSPFVQNKVNMADAAEAARRAS